MYNTLGNTVITAHIYDVLSVWFSKEYSTLLNYPDILGKIWKSDLIPLKKFPSFQLVAGH